MMKMKSITTYKKWDIILVPFPFTDLKAVRKRPSMIRMKFATIDKSIILKKIGRLFENDINEFTKLLIDFFTK